MDKKKIDSHIATEHTYLLLFIELIVIVLVLFVALTSDWLIYNTPIPTEFELSVDTTTSISNYLAIGLSIAGLVILFYLVNAYLLERKRKELYKENGIELEEE